MKRFDKRDVATELLDAAITEYLDHARHFAAYNLAAVSEELTSKLLRLSGQKDSVSLKLGALKAMTDALHQIELHQRVWWKELFRLKNTIKHMDNEADRFFDANIEDSARQKIGDAVGNVVRLGLPKSTRSANSTLILPLQSPEFGTGSAQAISQQRVSFGKIRTFIGGERGTRTLDPGIMSAVL
jgi:hypothetical protein